MKMTFGKHKGAEIHTIPKSYLNWLKNNVHNLDNNLRQAIDAGLIGQPYQAPTIEERIDQAKREIQMKLRARDAGRTLLRVVA